MILYILLAALAVTAIIALIAATKPDEWTVQRRGTIPGTPADVFPYVDDLHKFLEWSPWAKLDPSMKLTHGTPLARVGAHFSWEGNSKVGAGKLTITESRPNALVRYRFDFYKPITCANTHELVLQPEASQTLVTWIMKGKAPFYFKLILVFASADAMMGKDLELGLGNLKSLSAS